VSLPIGPYVRLQADVVEWDPRTIQVAAAVADLVSARRPDTVVEHIGSTAVPGLPGKGVVDLAIATTSDELPDVVAVLKGLGFGDQPGPDPWPVTRPMLVGSMDIDGATFRIHCHVQPGTEELERDIAFRDALRADPALTAHYADLKRGIVDGGLIEGHQYTYQKQRWIGDVHRRLGVERPPIAPPATIGLLGGGQLGRMLALAARAMGYRIAVLDPDPACPAASLADSVIVAGYDDVGAALRLATRCAVVTYELEHVAVEVVDAIDPIVPVHPGRIPLLMTQDRLAERRFVESIGAEVAPWREVRSLDDATVAAADLGFPLRLKVTTGGYDGRGQVRVSRPDELPGAWDAIAPAPGSPILAERELAFREEVSIIVMRGDDGQTATYPVSHNVHDAGILVESVAPAAIDPELAARVADLGERLAVAMGLTGTLTAELFLMPDDRIVVNELAPRVHNSGHWTLDGAATSQFEQHIRAICGLELGATDALAPTAMVNLWGEGRLRDARLDPRSVGRAMEDPAVHLHLYDKRRVFERRKMGHLTATATDPGAALAAARAARDALRWTASDEGGDR
jgi:5-(carboxyamino)imidazole ribonucleotide synthase